MEQQEITAIETTQAEIEEDFFQFADLDLTDEQLAEIKGGPWGCSWCGHTVGNHNETTARDETEEDAEEDFFQFADLSLTDEQLAEIKGGPWVCSWCGYTGGNHNETTADDEEAESESLDDLSVEDDEQVKGGPSGGITKLGSKLLTL